MNAIREYHSIKENREIKISIPEDFDATEVEIIVLPSKRSYIVFDEAKKMVMERRDSYNKNPDDTEDLDELLDELERDL